MTSVELDTRVLASLAPSKKFSMHKSGSITSIDFDDSGLWCLTAGDDESIQLYDCKTGKHSKTIYSKKYGVGLVRFTHDSLKCVYTSTKEDDTVRLLSLHDNQYIRYFRGHEARVISLEVSPVNDLMITTSMDDTVRIWDLRSASCQGLLNIQSPVIAGFDATGLVFALARQLTRKISLHSSQHYERAPFLVINTDFIPTDTIWVKIEFSNNGKLLLLVTDSDKHYLFDALKGVFLATLEGHDPLPSRDASMLMSHCAFSVDGRHVISGSDNKKLVLWRTESLELVESSDSVVEPKVILPARTIDCEHYAYILIYSPKTMLLATADKSLVFWLPDQQQSKSIKRQTRPDTQ